MKRIFKFGLCASLVFSAQFAFAVPKTVTEPVLMENSVMNELSKTEEGKEAFRFITSLTTYQDHAIPTKFYYYPAYRPSNSSGGAATVITNDAAIDRRQEIKHICKTLEGYSVDEYDTIRNAYLKLTQKLQDTSLNEEERAIINTARLQLKEELDALVIQAEENQQYVPEYVRNAEYEYMADIFGFSGIPITMEEIEDPGVRSSKLRTLSGSNGGFFSGNLITGFTAEEIDSLRYYKTVRANLNLPEVSLVVLPVQSIEFFSLAETFESYDGEEKIVGIPIFRSFAASGSITNASYNFDLTIDGAAKFSYVPPPINVPIGVKAKLTVRPPTFTAKLKCDFTNGWTLNGRTDIKDGLIIYNNDIFQEMVAKDISQTNKPCTIEITGGTGSEQEYAYTAALNELMERFEGLFFERAAMARQEKIEYWDGVQQDIAANRHRGANSGWSGFFGAARGLGFIGSIVGGFSNASRFYWHTDVRNITALSRVKFEKEIVVNQNQTIDITLGTADMCLAYNPALKRYVPCDDKEELGSVSVTEGATQAQESYLCNEDDTVSECAESREENVETNENNNVPPENEVDDPVITLPDEI